MKIKTLTTACGAPLYVVEMPHLQSVISGVLVKVGTRDEYWPQEAGLAHAFEHMVFRGNARFSDSRSLSSAIENLGGHLNAYTNKEQTFFYNRLPKNQFREAFPHLASLIDTPLFPESAIPLEMQTVLEEIKQYNDDPEAVVGLVAEELLFGPNHLARNVLGTSEAVSNFNDNDFQHWREELYHPYRFCFFVVGNVRADEMLESVNASFGGYPHGKLIFRHHADLVTLSENQSPQQTLKIVHRDVEQLKVCLLAKVPVSFNSESVALGFYAKMISSGMSSPLFQEVREKRGLCYSVGASKYSYSSDGVFSISIGTSPEKFSQALETIFAVIAENAANKDLFEKTKEKVYGITSIHYDDPFNILNKIVEEAIVLGAPETVEKSLEKIHNISLDRVKEAVEKYLQRDRFVTAIVAPRGFKLS